MSEEAGRLTVSLSVGDAINVADGVVEVAGIARRDGNRVILVFRFPRDVRVGPVIKREDRGGDS